MTENEQNALDALLRRCVIVGSPIYTQEMRTLVDMGFLAKSFPNKQISDLFRASYPQYAEAHDKQIAWRVGCIDLKTKRHHRVQELEAKLKAQLIKSNLDFLTNGDVGDDFTVLTVENTVRYFVDAETLIQYFLVKEDSTELYNRINPDGHFERTLTALQRAYKDCAEGIHALNTAYIEAVKPLCAELNVQITYAQLNQSLRYSY